MGLLGILAHEVMGIGIELRHLVVRHDRDLMRSHQLGLAHKVLRLAHIILRRNHLPYEILWLWCQLRYLTAVDQARSAVLLALGPLGLSQVGPLAVFDNLLFDSWLPVVLGILLLCA